jgi:ABC-type amino acid transport substrate-binding protein
VAKWVQLPPQKEKEKIEFTAEERAWLEQDHTIRVRFWQHPPYFYSKDGEVVGIAVDLLNAISENTGITFQLENRLDRFSGVLKGLREHEGPDLVGALMPTTERENSILFTIPYFNSPRFIFTRDDAPFISSIEHLSGKKITLVKDYVVHRNLVEKYPGIDLLISDTNEEALRAVSMGEAFAFIGDLVATPAMINEFGLKNLKAACPSGLPDHLLAIGIRNDWPELRDILSKALEAMPAHEKAAIINRCRRSSSNTESGHVTF